MNFIKNKKTNIQKITKNFIAPIILALFALSCSMFGGGSPTSVYKAFLAAAKKKDAAAMKECLSDDSLKSISAMAQSSGKSDDDFLRSSVSEKSDEISDYSNEKIAADGKTATLEIKTKGDKTNTVYFVRDGSRQDGAWKISFEKPKEKLAETTKSTPTDSSDSTSEPKETGPLTLSASGLLQDANNATSRMDSLYKDRMITITDGKLWEIGSSEIRIGSSTGSSGSIICVGSFSEYMPYSSKISELSRQGKAPGATVKGMYSRTESNSGNPKVYLDPCVLSNLEKP